MSAPPRRIRIRIAFALCAAAMVAAGTEYAAAVVLERRPFTVTAPLSLLVLIGLTVVFIGLGAAAVVSRYWLVPRARLIAAIDEAREGQLAIEHLPQDVGGLRPLVGPIREVFRELRRQRAEVAQLEAEIQRRVERRTESLQRMVGKLNAQATRDGLTGLYNRRMLDQTLEDVVRRCATEDLGLCLMMIDLDDFKLLNDTLGHAAGDSLLRAVGQLIRSSVREQDLPFRCGGDEFVVLLPEAEMEHGETLGRRLGDLVHALVKTLPLERLPGLSIGLSTLNGVGTAASGKDLMEAADRRLYAVKAGRKGKAGRAA